MSRKKFKVKIGSDMVKLICWGELKKKINRESGQMS